MNKNFYTSFFSGTWYILTEYVADCKVPLYMFLFLILIRHFLLWPFHGRWFILQSSCAWFLNGMSGSKRITKEYPTEKPASLFPLSCPDPVWVGHPPQVYTWLNHALFPLHRTSWKDTHRHLLWTSKGGKRAENRKKPENPVMGAKKKPFPFVNIPEQNWGHIFEREQDM